MPQDLLISQLLPTVKCSSCTEPVPLDRLGDHICVPPLASSDTKSSRPPLNAQTATSSPRSPPSSPMNSLLARRRPSTNKQQDARVHDGARLRNDSNPSRGAAPSRTPSKDGVRSPGPVMPPTSPSRPAQRPF